MTAKQATNAVRKLRERGIAARLEGGSLVIKGADVARAMHVAPAIKTTSPRAHGSTEVAYPYSQGNPPSKFTLLSTGEHGDEYFQRKIGDAIVHIRPRPDRDYVYEGLVLLPSGESWPFDDLHAAPFDRGRRSEDDEDLIDELSCSAVSFGSDAETNGSRSLAQEIEDATAFAMRDDASYEVMRMNPEGPPPGVPASAPLKKNPNPDYQWFVAVFQEGEREPFIIFSGWEFKNDAKDDLQENRDHYFNEAQGGLVKIFARRSLENMRVDPDDQTNWFSNTKTARPRNRI